MYFRITPLGAYCLEIDSTYPPAPVEVEPVLRVLPNLEVAAIGAELEPGDRLALDAYAAQVSDLVWRLDPGALLVATDEGRAAEEIREFLNARCSTTIPDTVPRQLEDVSNRSGKVRDRGLAHPVECADAALAALIANHSRTRKHCMRPGERHLVVPASSEAAFKRTRCVLASSGRSSISGPASAAWSSPATAMRCDAPAPRSRRPSSCTGTAGPGPTLRTASHRRAIESTPDCAACLNRPWSRPGIRRRTSPAM